jgi:hypothetical protein
MSTFGFDHQNNEIIIKGYMKDGAELLANRLMKKIRGYFDDFKEIVNGVDVSGRN